MTHDELLASIEQMMNHDAIFMKDALRAVVELHKPSSSMDMKAEPMGYCKQCAYEPTYPCPTIQAIEKELK